MSAEHPFVTSEQAENTADDSVRRATLRSWLMAGTATGMVGGMVAGLVEPVYRMGSMRDLMTARLWADALSSSAISHVAVGVVACAVGSLAGGLGARFSHGWRRHFHPVSFALAALVVVLVIMTVWGEGAEQYIRFFRGTAGLTWAFLIGVLGVVPIGWVFERIRIAISGRRSRGVGRTAAAVAAVWLVTAIGIQWHGRPRVQSSEGFWPLRSQATPRPANMPPDIVLVVFDTLRADRLGCYGYARPTSPHIDAFAADAVRFRHAISPAVYTQPAHASIFTGLFPSQHGVDWGRSWLNGRFQTLAEILHDRGYQTIALSNNPNVSPATNLTQGFYLFTEPMRLSASRLSSPYKFVKRAWAEDGPLGALLGRWFVHDPGGRATTVVTAEVLRRRDRSRPFFLFINYMEPHLPYEPSGAYRKLFVAADDLVHSYRIDQSIETVCEYNLACKSVYGARDLKVLSDLYDGRVRELDDHFADLMRVLAREVNLDETLIILTADHGENLGEHELLEHQFCVYNTLIHVPLILRWPKVLRPQRVDRVVQTSDLFPTVLDWVGAEGKQPTKVLARSLAEALKSDTQDARGKAIAEYLSAPPWQFEMVRLRHPTFDPAPWTTSLWAVFDYPWKLIVRSDKRLEVYNLSSDPDEQRNLAGQQRDVSARLERHLADWQGSFEHIDPNTFGAPPRQRFDRDQIRRLRDLGYVQ